MDPNVTAAREARWAAHAEGVRRLAHALVYDPDRADDVAQEAMRIAIERPPAEGRSLAGWLAGIVRNVARNVVRGDRHRREREHRAARAEAVDAEPDWGARLAEQRRAIDAVLALDEPYRTAVTLHYFEGLSLPEVARRTGAPLETVRTRLRRARERLRAVLDAAHRGDRDRWMRSLLPFGGTAVGVGGAMVMNKVVAVLVAASVLGLGTWWFVARDAADVHRPSEPTPAGVIREVEGPAEEGPRLAGTVKPTETTDPVAPPPVDLAKVDRERDLHGVVVDRAGAPVPGARVLAVTRTWERTTPGDFVVRERVHGETTSSVDGTFAIRLERGQSVNFRVEAAGFGTWEEAFAAAGGRVRIVLGPAVRLVMRVKGDDGSAVQGARVRFFQAGAFMVGMARARYAFLREERTDGAGVVAFDELPVGVWGYADVTHPRWGKSDGGWKRLELSEPGERVEEIVLRTGRTVTGRVTDAATGAPVAGAAVGEGWWLERGVTTDSEGRFSFPGWTGAGGETEMSAWAPGFVLARVAVGEREEIEFSLVAGCRARGRVLDPSGLPLAGASVRARSDADPGGATVDPGVTGTDGGFEIASLDPRTAYRFQAELDGFATARTGPRPPAGDAEWIDVGDVRLGRSFAIEGRILDENGHPIEGLEIIVGERGTWRVSDDLGRFRVPDLDINTHTLRIRGEGRETVTREVRILDRDVSGIEVRMESGLPLEVVLDAEGAALPDALGVAAVGSDGVVRVAHAGTDGRVVFRLPAGAARVRLSSYSGDWIAPAERAAEAGGPLVRLTLKRPATITGVLRGPDGKPLEAQVTWQPSRGMPRAASTDGKGRFRLPAEPGTSVDVTFTTAEDRRPERKPVPLYAEAKGVPAGTEGLEIKARVVAVDRRLRLLARDPEGRPIEDVTVFYDMRSWKTDAEGRVSLDSLPAHPITLTAMAGGERIRSLGWLPERVTGVVPDGQEVEIRFRMGLRVTGTVVGAKGTIQGAGLQATHDGEGVAWGNTGPDGAFALTVDPATAFPLVLVVHVPGDRARELRVDVERPPTAPIEVRVPGS